MATGRIYEAIAARLQQAGTRIETSSEPIEVQHDGKRITEVDFRFADGSVRTLRPDRVVESVPITRFLDLLQPPPPPEVRAAAKELKWRAQVCLFLTLDKDSVTKDNWICFPNTDIPFGRTRLEQWGLFARKDVRQACLIKRPCVYPVYDMRYDERLAVVRGWLDQLQNLIYLGRPGRFRYTNQDHSLEMGITACQMILEGRHYDLDAIGGENEYFEKGPIYEKRL